MDIRKEEMSRLRSEGYTLQEIGYLYHVSKERVRQILGKAKKKDFLEPDEEGYRRCARCKEYVAEEWFYSEKCNVCIDCTKEKQKEIMKANPEYKKGGKYYDKASCRRKTHYLVKTGKLKKGECKMKSGECFGRIEAHHYAGYDHPELVEWYCNKHHREVEGRTPFGRKT